MAARVPVVGATLAPCSLRGPCFGLGGWARAGREQRLELGDGGGARRGLPTGAQLLLLLLLLDDKLLLLLRRRLWLHRLRRLLQELGGLQRGIGCGDSKGDRDPPSSPAPQPQGTHPQDSPLGGCCSLYLFPLVPSDNQLCQLPLLMWEAALRLSQGGPQFWEPCQCSIPGSSSSWSPTPSLPQPTAPYRTRRLYGCLDPPGQGPCQ